jgi:hypothetical protein
MHYASSEVRAEPRKLHTNLDSLKRLRKLCVGYLSPIVSRLAREDRGSISVRRQRGKKEIDGQGPDDRTPRRRS